MWHLVRDQTSSALIIVIHHEERVHIHTLIHDQIGLNSSNSHDYTLQHRALTERWIHPRDSQRRSGTTEASKTKAEVRVHGQRSGSVRSMSAKILFAKIYSHKESTMSSFQNAISKKSFRPHSLYCVPFYSKS